MYLDTPSNPHHSRCEQVPEHAVAYEESDLYHPKRPQEQIQA